MAMTLYTVGHGRLSFDRLVELLQAVPVAAVVDVRTAPGSRLHPHVNREVLKQTLPQANIAYRWEPRLGGFRKPRPNSSNEFWENDNFRGYADYMQTPEFWLALDELLVQAATRPTTVMCSESVWWRCHRRLIADAAVLARDAQVLHIYHDGRVEPHRVTAGARQTQTGIAYPAPQTAIWQ